MLGGVPSAPPLVEPSKEPTTAPAVDDEEESESEDEKEHEGLSDYERLRERNIGGVPSASPLVEQLRTTRGGNSIGRNGYLWTSDDEQHLLIWFNDYHDRNERIDFTASETSIRDAVALAAKQHHVLTHLTSLEVN